LRLSQPHTVLGRSAERSDRALRLERESPSRWGRADASGSGGTAWSSRAARRAEEVGVLWSQPGVCQWQIARLSGFCCPNVESDASPLLTIVVPTFAPCESVHASRPSLLRLGPLPALCAWRQHLASERSHPLRA